VSHTARERVLTCDGRQIDERVVLALIAAGTFLAPLDSSIVNIALPAIAGDLGARLPAVGWVATSYVLTIASLVLAMGRLADIHGLRRIYVLGFLVFAAGSAACAIAPSLGVLIATRVLQATGAAMMFAAGPALLNSVFPRERKGWAIGWISLSVSAGLTVGPALGGTLVELFGWQGIFVINVPLALGIAAVARRILPEDCPGSEPFDIPGAVLAAAALTLSLLALSEISRSGPIAVSTLALAGGAVVCGAAFVAVEKRVAHPLLDLSLFERWPLLAGLLAAVLGYVALFSVTFTMPFYLMSIRGLSPQSAGLLLTATPLAMAVFAPLAGRASDRGQGHRLSTVGLGLLAATLGCFTLLGRETHPALIALGLFLVGTGLAIFLSPNTADILRATPRARAGVGSALIGQARNIGMAFGIGITALVISLGTGDVDVMSSRETLSPAQGELFVSAMRSAFALAALLSLAAGALAWSRGANRAVRGRGSIDELAPPRVDSRPTTAGSGDHE